MKDWASLSIRDNKRAMRRTVGSFTVALGRKHAYPTRLFLAALRHDLDNSWFLTVSERGLLDIILLSYGLWPDRRRFGRNTMATSNCLRTRIMTRDAYMKRTCQDTFRAQQS